MRKREDLNNVLEEIETVLFDGTKEEIVNTVESINDTPIYYEYSEDYRRFRVVCGKSETVSNGVYMIPNCVEIFGVRYQFV